MSGRIRVLAGLLAVAMAAGLPGCAGGSGRQQELVVNPEPVGGWGDVKAVTRAGQFTFAGQPTEAALERFAAEGGAVVVDLRTHEGADTPAFDEPTRVRDLGMEYVHLPVTPQTLDRADVQALARAARSAKGPVLVHCASSNRVGGLWAAYLRLEQGVPAEEAIAVGKAAGMRSAEVEEAARRVMGE